MRRKTSAGQEVVYFLEAETWITKRPGSGGGQEANKMADEGATVLQPPASHKFQSPPTPLSFFGITTNDNPNG